MISGVYNSSSKQSENHKNIFLVLGEKYERFSIKILQNQEQNYKEDNNYLLIKYKFAVKSFYIITPPFWFKKHIYRFYKS